MTVDNYVSARTVSIASVALLSVLRVPNRRRNPPLANARSLRSAPLRRTDSRQSRLQFSGARELGRARQNAWLPPVRCGTVERERERERKRGRGRGREEEKEKEGECSARARQQKRIGECSTTDTPHASALTEPQPWPVSRSYKSRATPSRGTPPHYPTMLCSNSAVPLPRCCAAWRNAACAVPPK